MSEAVTVIQNARLWSDGLALAPTSLQSVAVQHGLIRWTGADHDLPNAYKDAKRIDANARLLTPALIDCHTHLVFGGNRADEFAQRLRGKTYAQIAVEGGGIMSTVRATRALSVEQLVAQSLPRARHLVSEGVGTIEIKSGYGLEIESERKMLQAARAIGRELGISVKTTYLALHALPPEAKSGAARRSWVDSVINDHLPCLAGEGLVDAVDAFCEPIAFDLAEIELLFEAAARLNIRCKLHAEQLSNSHGSTLAARFGALSVDHLEYLDEAGVIAIQQSGTVATLLPAAFYCLKETKLPPVQMLRERGVPMAVASDCNPGTAPQSSLRLAMHQACTLFGLNVEEALAGVTRHAASALGLLDRGQIALGQRADVVLWDVESAAEIVYWLGPVVAQRISFDHNQTR
jgi:imidazolonepropionase